MNEYATKKSLIRVLTCPIWVIVLLTMVDVTASGVTTATPTPLLGVVSPDPKDPEALFPWLTRYRWKKWTLHRYRKWRKAYRQAKRRVQLARLAMTGMMTMAEMVDWLTASQLRYKLGPCQSSMPSYRRWKWNASSITTVQPREKWGMGPWRWLRRKLSRTVLMLNRLVLPLPLYQIADWVGETFLVATLGNQTGEPSQHAVFVHYGDDDTTQTLDSWFHTYNGRQTIEAGIKEGKNIFQMHHLKIRSAPALLLQEHFACFAEQQA